MFEGNLYEILSNKKIILIFHRSNILHVPWREPT
jgi:hypothetical protein